MRKDSYQNHGAISDPRPIPGVRAICGNVTPPKQRLHGSFIVIGILLLPVAIALGVFVKWWLAPVGVFLVLIAFLVAYCRALQDRKRFRVGAQARLTRLQRLYNLPHARERLPHRFLELALLEDGFVHNVSSGSFLDLPPGPAIVIGLRPSATWVRDLSAVECEPLSFGADLEDLGDLWTDRGGIRPAASNAPNIGVHGLTKPGTEPPRFRPKSANEKVKIGMQRQLLYLLIAAFCFGLAHLLKLPWATYADRLISFTLSLGTIWLLAYLRTERHWLVPGGILVQPKRVGRRKIAKLRTPQNARLLIRVGPSFRQVSMDFAGKVSAIYSSDDDATLLALSLFWRDGGAPPQVEQLEAYFGEGFVIEQP